MSDKFIEKKFLYLIVVSLLLHLGVFAALYFFPPSPPELHKEPVFVDLKIPPVSKQQDIVKKIPRKVVKEAESKRETVKSPPAIDNKKYFIPPKGSQTPTKPKKYKGRSAPRQEEHKPPQDESGSSISSLLKSKKVLETPRLKNDFTINKDILKRIEEQTKNKLTSENKAEGFGVGDGTGLDFSLVSFARRFLDGATSHLVYPPRAKRLGLEGVGIGEVTFNRKGEVINIIFTKSVGKDFDDAVINAIRNTVIGPLPKAYKEDTATLPFVYVFQLPPQERR